MLDRDQIVNDIRTATEEVFATMLSTELTFSESFFDDGPAHPVDGVVCLIGLAGAWTGTGTVSCSAAFACHIASRMLMAEYTEVGADVLDAVAEVTNMVLGNVKTALEQSLGSMGLSIPTAVFGRNFMAKSFGGETWTVVLFQHEQERLEVKLFLKRANTTPANGLGKPHTPVYLRS